MVDAKLVYRNAVGRYRSCIVEGDLYQKGRRLYIRTRLGRVYRVRFAMRRREFAARSILPRVTVDRMLEDGRLTFDYTAASAGAS